METIFQRADMSMEYRKALKKATSEKPEDRYETPQALLKAVQSHRSMMHSAWMLLAAVIIALVAFGIQCFLHPVDLCGVCAVGSFCDLDFALAAILDAKIVADNVVSFGVQTLCV
jgi:hypothetical protein